MTVDVEVVVGVLLDPAQRLQLGQYARRRAQLTQQVEGPDRILPGDQQAQLGEPALACRLGCAGSLGALMHDIGKPATKGQHAGYVTFIGHDSVGADQVVDSLARLKASRALSRYVEGLTRNHLHLGFMVHERPVPRRRLYEYLARCGDVAPDVTLLTAADRMSARGSGAIAAPEMINAHLDLVREVLPAALDWHEAGPPPVPIPGDELARELGIEEGPRLGELIESLRAAVFAGEVADREAAIEHARRALDQAASD